MLSLGEATWVDDMNEMGLFAVRNAVVLGEERRGRRQGAVTLQKFPIKMPNTASPRLSHPLIR